LLAFARVMPATRVVALRVGVLVDEVESRDDAAGELGMGRVDPGVQDRDHDRRAPGAERPSLDGGDVRSRRASDLAGVVEVPLVREVRVVRGHLTALADHVGLGVSDTFDLR
jgi:hypothetical protein